ncbi:MAG: two component system sensor protein [Desulfobacterales bacterium RIFOXYA12_FULL_46_15]|nr:MAG: two component system sensor protein [Desulfobacterales bacterium RIFOXYA12_FULL_46_15]
MNSATGTHSENREFVKTITTAKALPLRITIPVALTLILFTLTIFLLIIPLMEKNMMDGKRQALMHLTETAWSTLSLYHDQAREGVMSGDEAREAAIRHLGRLRYGPDFKDYFWINDMKPVMIMHPYRPDLVGKDISAFEDPSGKPLFAEMVKVVRENKAGFVDYLWQWQEDSTRIIPKISYVREFEPWGWIIGTGIYVDDVRADILTITRRLTWTCIGIMGVVFLLSGYIIRTAALAEKERQKALAQSRLREKQLIQADKMSSLGILVAGVAHEINNPVTSIMLNAPNLKKAWDGFTPALDAHFSRNPSARVCNMAYPELRKRIELMLGAIQDGAARIKRIISELKDFSRPAEDRMDQYIDVNRMVKESMNLTRPMLKKNTPLLTVAYGENLPLIQGNFSKLQQVMINLLVNAGQALTRPEQSIHVETHLSNPDGFLIIEVTDTGPGVAPEHISRVKDPFFTTRRDDGGMGLGLSISEKIVNDHGGTLELISPPGQGLTARIVLPIKPLYFTASR